MADNDTHDICLNIHYSIPDNLWNKVIDVFKSMPYWVEEKDRIENCLFWYDENECVELYCSVEPSGIQISGLMMYGMWEKWYNDLKKKLTQTLEYEIGEPEDGYDFIYWNQ